MSDIELYAAIISTIGLIGLLACWLITKDKSSGEE